jgi:hypothetical protein
MSPTHQGLDTREAAITKSHQRLEVQEKLAFVLQRLSQIGHQGESAGTLPFMFERESHEGASWLLGHEERDVRAAQQRVRVIAVIRENGDADTDGDVEVLPLDLEGPLQRLE